VAAVEETRPGRRLGDTAFAGSARIFRSDGPQNPDAGRNHIQGFGNILANLVQRAAAAGTVPALRFDHLDHTRQPFRQLANIPPGGLALATRRRWERNDLDCGNGDRVRRLAQFQAHLSFDDQAAALGARAEDLAIDLLDSRFQRRVFCG
jgi:hypothetical protein